jgi:hypothetical protein
VKFPLKAAAVACLLKAVRRAPDGSAQLRGPSCCARGSARCRICVRSSLSRMPMRRPLCSDSGRPLAAARNTQGGVCQLCVPLSWTTLTATTAVTPAVRRQGPPLCPSFVAPPHPSAAAACMAPATPHTPPPNSWTRRLRTAPAGCSGPAGGQQRTHRPISHPPSFCLCSAVRRRLFFGFRSNPRAALWCVCCNTTCGLGLAGPDSSSKYAQQPAPSAAGLGRSTGGQGPGRRRLAAAAGLLANGLGECGAWQAKGAC